MRISQAGLAARLGVSFQQVQKYERGANRVSASSLYETARALGVTVAHFFEGLDSPAVEPFRDPVSEMLTSPGGGELATAWLTIPPGPMRGRLADLARAIAAGIREGMMAADPLVEA